MSAYLCTYAQYRVIHWVHVVRRSFRWHYTSHFGYFTYSGGLCTKHSCSFSYCNVARYESSFLAPLHTLNPPAPTCNIPLVTSRPLERIHFPNLEWYSSFLSLPPQRPNFIAFVLLEANECALEAEILGQVSKSGPSDWLVTNSTLELLANDLQSLINCTESGDIMRFQLETPWKPLKTMFIPHQLTFINEGNIESSLTSPDEGPLLQIE